jgi:hypothetical protein
MAIKSCIMLYLRKERVWDFLTKHYQWIVAAYHDNRGMDHVATWPIGQSKPRKGCKSVMLNCVNQPCEWLPDSHTIIRI